MACSTAAIVILEAICRVLTFLLNPAIPAQMPVHPDAFPASLALHRQDWSIRLHATIRNIGNLGASSAATAPQVFDSDGRCHGLGNFRQPDR